jgi:antitoxin component of MazEF toxin-antitoxin module
MARQKIADSNIRKLTRTGGGKSIGLTLPIEYVRELGWKDRQKVVVKKQGQKLVIEDWKG